MLTKAEQQERTFDLTQLNLPGAQPVKVTSQEFKRLAKLHAHAGKPGRCFHEVLLREKGKTREYRCAVCKTLFKIQKENVHGDKSDHHQNEGR